MVKHKHREKLIELLKDVLILVLACSAVWMITGGGLGQGGHLTQGEAPAITGPQTPVGESGDSVGPMSMVYTLRAGEEVPQRRVLWRDDAALDAQFQQVAGLLMEVMSSTSQPEAVHRREWRAALAQAPGLFFDFQGEIPLSVLAGYLKVEHRLPDGVARQLLLTVWQDQVALYYHELSSDTYYRCTTQVVSPTQLETALEGQSANGAFYAFESELTRHMAPDTLLTTAAGPLPHYVAANPVSGGRAALEGLMTELNFNLSGCVFYSAADEEVARQGSDTLRLSTTGVLEYHTDREGAQQFPVAEISGRSGAFAAAESCRALLSQVTAGRIGQGRLYLSRVESVSGGWDLEFEYSLNGVPLTMEEGPAAAFTVRGEHITGFVLRLRNYTAGGGEQLILPPVQAAAAMDALSLGGRELQVMYRDRGEETVIPNWMAAAE